MKITIRSIIGFNKLMNSVLKVVPSALFNINEKGVIINCANETGTVRAFFESDCVVSEVESTFALKDLAKLRKSLEVIQKIEEVDEAEISLGKVFLTYSNTAKFKIRQIMPELIERYITEEIKTELVSLYTFTTSARDIKNALKCSSIVASEDNKVYFSVSDDRIIAEIDNKQDDHADGIGIPINNIEAGITGSVDKVVATTIDNFRIFGILDINDISVTYTNRSVFKIEAFEKVGDYSIKLNMITSTVKG